MNRTLRRWGARAVLGFPWPPTLSENGGVGDKQAVTGKRGGHSLWGTLAVGFAFRLVRAVTWCPQQSAWVPCLVREGTFLESGSSC